MAVKVRAGFLFGLCLLGVAARAEDGDAPPLRRQAGVWATTLGIQLPPPSDPWSLLDFSLVPSLHYFLSRSLLVEGEITLVENWRMSVLSAANGSGFLKDASMGARLRLTPLPSAWTPSLAAGFEFTTGTFGSWVEVDGFRYRQKPALFSTLAAGAEYLAPRGLFLLAEIHFTRDLSGDHLEVVYFDGKGDSSRRLVAALRENVSISFSFGAAFGK